MRRLSLALVLLPLLLMPGLASAQSTPGADAPLAGTAWRWHEFQSSNDTMVTPEPDQPGLIVFRPDGVLVVATNCAAGEGTWVESPEGIDLDLSAVDQTDCPENSATALLLRDLDMSTSYVLDDGNLFIALPMDGGIHEFSPSLAGITWSWVEFQGGNDSLWTPEADEEYQVTFAADGAVTVETPCATGEGTFRETANGLEIDLSGIDLADCADNSPTRLLVRDLDMSTSYVMQDGYLWIALPMDGGIHQFAPRWPEDAAI